VTRRLATALLASAVAVSLAACQPATTTAQPVTVTDPCALDPECNPWETPAVPPTPTIPECIEEDGPGPCYWDAQARGNGEGTSFFIDANGEFYYPAP